MLNPEARNQFTNFANHLADLSSKIAKKYFRLPNGEIAKDDDTPVTKADREIEKMMRAEIQKEFPTHGIIGEEFGTQNPDADFVWVLDPIDGTSSFITGKPIFGTLIALSYKKKPILGLMNQPITTERWIGVDGHEATLDGKKIQTRNCVRIEDAVLCTCSPYFFNSEDEKLFKLVSSKTKYQSFGGVIYGGDCYIYAMLASGFVDLIIDPGLKVYDYAALLPIIEMAGGVISDWDGNALNLRSGVKILAAGTKELHQAALKLIHSN